MTNCNSYDSRCGFTSSSALTGKEMEKFNKYCQILMQERELGEPFKGRFKISDLLINTTIPQIFSGFIDKKNMEACALGAIHLEVGGHRNSCKPDWDLIINNCDLYDEELDRREKCPKCDKVNAVASLIYHMNDVHEMTNKQIGKWLKRYGL